ncbi:MAG: ABC-F family ATP-binding cassette domain-containing protein [Johnsonella sp.]|nr:ABC-F family ATP-binding cassette domain-containing protein [Johnsonella sp.]
MIIHASNISKAFKGEYIIKDANLLVNENEKLAIVGANGAGKTTLLRMLAGELKPDSGSVAIPKHLNLGFLRQINDIDSDLSMEEELYTVIRPILDMEERLKKMQEDMVLYRGEELDKLYEDYTKLTHEYEMAEGYLARSRVSGILKGLGFSEEEFSRPINKLSGGQKTRVFLGKLLLLRPDIILLDEPTNHLDLSSIEWLETYLLNYKGTVIIVSHDRYFLDRIVNRVIDVENTLVSSYSGNYSAYYEKKAMLRRAALKAYLNQQEEIRHQEAVIEKLKSFNREKSVKRAQSRQKQLDKMDLLQKPMEERSDMRLFFDQAEESGKDVLRVENLAKSFDCIELFSDLNFELKKGEHLAIIGDNGTGKTTILKILNGLIEPDKGSISFGSKVQIAYFDQEHQVLHPEKTLFDEIQDSYPDLDNTKVRNILAAFLFTGDEVFKKIKNLSGGERGRISLAKLMLSKANLLILDEPTNHLDMVSKEILEAAIREFPGTLIYVSHDRYFINKTATRILELKEKSLLNYIGNYDYYLEKKADVEAAFKIEQEKYAQRLPAENKKSTKEDWLASKEEAARAKKRKANIEKCEERIAALESDIASIDSSFLDPAIQSDAVRLLELQRKREQTQSDLHLAYIEWEELLSEED